MKRIVVGLLVGSLLVALGLYGWFRYQTRDLNLDQAEVEALAERLLPGSRPVGNGRGVASFEKGDLKVAVLAPSLRKARPDRLQGPELRFAIVGLEKQADTGDLDQMVTLIEQVRAEQQEKGIVTTEKAPNMVTVAGRPYPSIRMTQQMGEGGPLVEEILIPFKGEKETALLLVTGPKASFNTKEMQQFLDGLKVTVPSPPRVGKGQRPERGKHEPGRIRSGSPEQWTRVPVRVPGPPPPPRP